jgi:death-on-curing protein
VTEYLSMADLGEIASMTLGDYQIRDPGLLASALVRPQMSVFGQDAYPSLADKAAALMHSIARNHCLVDGNKRLAFMAAWTFCGLNGWRLTPPSVDEGENLVLAVARGELDGPELASALSSSMERRADEQGPTEDPL